MLGQTISHDTILAKLGEGGMGVVYKVCAFDPAGADRRIILPKYHYALARLLEKKGERDRAIREYETSLTFLKDADPDLPEVKDSRSRLVILKNRAIH